MIEHEHYTVANSWHIQLIVAFGYALLIFSLKMIMRSRSLPDSAKKILPSVIYWHNISLSFASTVMGVIIVYETVNDGRYNSFHDAACRVTPNAGLYYFVNQCYIWSKIWEFLDTVFLCLNRKQVIFLHFWHHMTTFALATVVFNFPSGAFAYINCFIHTLMYLHYAHPRRFFRPIMTTLQIVQFLVVIGIHLYTYFAGCHPSVDLYFTEYLIDLFLCSSYLVLFINFYLQQYIKPRNTKKRE